VIENVDYTNQLPLANMSDNLNAIDWSNITHAYGRATDLPATLRALAFGNGEECDRALWELHGNIWHQGTVYEATAYAVPFLLDLVKINHARSAEILSLLALIASGSSHLERHGNLLKMSEAIYDAKLTQELEWVTQAKKAVAAGSPLFIELMAAKDLRIREMSIFLLGLTRAVSSPSDDISEVEIIERIHGIES